MNRIIKALILPTALLICSPSTAQSSSDPAKSISNVIDALKSNDLAALIQTTVGEAEFTNMGEQWEQQRQNRKSEITEQERQEFAAMVQLVTAPQAEENLFLLVEPKLVEYQASLMQMVALFQGLGAMQIQQSPDLDAEAKQNLTAALNQTAQWVTANDLTNKEKMRSAISIVVARSRELEITSIDDVMDLDYQSVLEKGGAVFSTFREVLQHYNVEVDSFLDSMSAETLENDGQSAVVLTKFEFFGIPQEIKTTLINHEGNWISEDALAQAKVVSALAAMPRQQATEVSTTQIGSASVSSSNDGEDLQHSLANNPFLNRSGIELKVTRSELYEEQQ